ncbi:hypothetical protein INR49_012862 [Caranx melampygus]|nr:hypothetical protein INR49_012862 [Caranx melampygus]
MAQCPVVEAISSQSPPPCHVVQRALESSVLREPWLVPWRLMYGTTGSSSSVVGPPLPLLQRHSPSLLSHLVCLDNMFPGQQPTGSGGLPKLLLLHRGLHCLEIKLGRSERR